MEVSSIELLICQLANKFCILVLAAELLNKSIPKFIELHNYVPSSQAHQKKINWNLLNRKALNKLNMKVGDALIQQIIDSKPGAVEPVSQYHWRFESSTCHCCHILTRIFTGFVGNSQAYSRVRTT
jgi:hypothetical protein